MCFCKDFKPRLFEVLASWPIWGSCSQAMLTATLDSTLFQFFLGASSCHFLWMEARQVMSTQRAQDKAAHLVQSKSVSFVGFWDNFEAHRFCWGFLI